MYGTKSAVLFRIRDNVSGTSDPHTGLRIQILLSSFNRLYQDGKKNSFVNFQRSLPRKLLIRYDTVLLINRRIFFQKEKFETGYI